MTTRTISNFLNNDLGDYAFYKVLTQLPNNLDGLTVTQRKIIWVLSKYPDKKFKTAQTYSYLLNETNYIHGDVSVYNTANNLAAKFKNNLNLITPYSNFGTRSIPRPASPRYTELKFSKLAKLIFPKIDFNLLPTQKFEGQEIEPYYMAPIIPLALINGNSGIALGYSNKVIGRHPIAVLDLLLGILKKEITNIPSQIDPWVPYFKGNIAAGNNDKQWIFKGIIKKVKKNTNTGILEIIEIPFQSRENYIEKVLSSLRESGTVISYSDSCEKNKLEFKIKVPIEVYNKSNDELLNLFGLISTQSETLTFLDRTNGKLELLEFNNMAEYLFLWIKNRAKLYTERKEFLLKQLESDLIKLENRIRFITEIVNNQLIVNKKKKSVIEKELKSTGYIQYDDNYNYLLNMPIYNLTNEKIAELQKTFRDKKKEYNLLKKTKSVDLWIDDLEKLKEELIKDVTEKEI